MVKYEDALTSLGIDYPDKTQEKVVKQKLAAAIKTLEGAVGADVYELMPDDARADELVCTYLDDLYSNRGVSAKVSGATRALVYNMEQQLRLELRGLREEAAGA